MIDDLLQERCALAVERYVAGILDAKPDRWGHVCAAVPWADSGWFFTQASIPRVIREVHAAFDARVWFDKEGPPWMRPLPLGEECVDLLDSRGGMHLLGLYAFSLQLLNYNYRRHPHPHKFFSGVMAHPSAPDHVKNDLELREKFPPKRLPGLCGRMIWFSPAESVAA